jgi:aryl-alcohol dehydrogenase-like predicted oxidoreductase
LAGDATLDYVERLSDFAGERGHSLLELAFAWLAAQDGVGSIIAGATSREQVLTNVLAGNAWRLSTEDLAAIPPRF